VSKYTPWFPGHIKPVRVGVYQQRLSNNPDACIGYQYWDGGLWWWWRENPNDAYRSRMSDIYPIHKFQNDSWRGLTKESK
jgi:hypothetical protein